MNWKKIILWALAALVAFPIGLTIVGLLAVKLSPSVRRGILAQVERYVGESTGAQIAIRDFTLDISRFGLQLEGIEARRPGSQSAPPLLRIDQVSAEINVDSVLKRQWNLKNLVIHHPVVHVFVDRAGESNLPPLEANAGGGMGTIFDLAIEKCMIERGEIFFNDAKNRLEAEIYNLQLNAKFDRSVSRYHGVARYDRGKIEYGAYAPVLHAMEATFSLTAAKLTIDRLAVTAGQSHVVVHGAVENFGSPVVQAAYDAQLAAGDLARMLKNDSLPEGTVHLTGSLKYESRCKSAFLQNAFLAGDLSSSVLQVKMKEGRAEVRDLSATYNLAGGNVEIQNFRAQVLGGILKANLAIRDVANSPRARLQAHLHDASVEKLEAAAQQHLFPEAHLRGKISADTEVTWGRTLTDLVARVDATLEGSLGQNPSAPLSGAVHARYAAASHEIEMRRSYVRTPSTSLTLDGKGKSVV